MSNDEAAYRVWCRETERDHINPLSREAWNIHKAEWLADKGQPIRVRKVD